MNDDDSYTDDLGEMDGDLVVVKDGLPKPWLGAKRRITIHYESSLDDTQMAELNARAEADGVTPQTYLQRLIEGHLQEDRQTAADRLARTRPS